MRICRPAGVLVLILILALAATVSAATGAIQLNVHPAGGTVCLGTVCKDNPETAEGVGTVTFDGLETDQYYMVNVFGVDGYKPYLKQIHLDSLSTVLIRDITLEPVAVTASGTGTVKVFITPDGGKACLDRMCELSSGDGTGSWSVEFAEVSSDRSHTLTISAAGYEPFTAEMRVQPGQTRSMSVTLDELQPGSTTPPATSSPATPAPEPVPTPMMPLPPGIAILATCICGLGIVLFRQGRM